MNIRPIQIGQRAELLASHVEKPTDDSHPLGLTAPAVLEKLAAIPLVEVWIFTLGGGWLILARHTHPKEKGTFRLFWIKSHPPSSTTPRIKVAVIPTVTVPQLSADPILW